MGTQKDFMNPKVWDEFKEHYRKSCRDAVHYLFGDHPEFNSMISSFKAVMNTETMQKALAIKQKLIGKGLDEENKKQKLPIDVRYYKDYSEFGDKMVTRFQSVMFQKLIDPDFQIPKLANYDGLDMPVQHLRDVKIEYDSYVYNNKFMETDTRISLIKHWSMKQQKLNSANVEGCEMHTQHSDIMLCLIRTVLSDKTLGLEQNVIDDWQYATRMMYSIFDPKSASHSHSDKVNNETPYSTHGDEHEKAATEGLHRKRRTDSDPQSHSPHKSSSSSESSVDGV